MERFYKSLLCFVVCFILLVSTVTSLESASLIGGKKASIAEIKYLVSLQSEGEHFCGGSIIADRFILSAAHCVIGDSNEFENKTIKVVAGTSNLHINDSHLIELDVEKIYVPSAYNNSEWDTSIPYGDIAVLKIWIQVMASISEDTLHHFRGHSKALNQTLDLKNNENLKKLRLPRPNRRYRNKYKTYEGESVLIAGFGWNKVKVKMMENNTEYEEGSSSDRLYRANAKVISNFECQEHYTNTIRPSDLCARVVEHDDNTPQGVCRGDSGGPLVHKLNTIIGIVSGISIGCNENNEPGIYSRVSSHMSFIRNAMRDYTRKMKVKTF